MASLAHLVGPRSQWETVSQKNRNKVDDSETGTQTDNQTDAHTHVHAQRGRRC